MVMEEADGDGGNETIDNGGDNGPTFAEDARSSIFHPVPGTRKSEDIELQIESAIVSGKISPGNRLPSERCLQSQFKASRGAIREAMRTLRQKGFLQAKKGSKGGYYVKEFDLDEAIGQLAWIMKKQKLSMGKLLQFQFAMDQAVLQVAIANATNEELERMSELSNRLLSLCREEVPDFEEILCVDRGLNLLLVAMTKNPFFEWIMRTIQLSFRSYEFVLYEDPVIRMETAANWRNTADALMNRDAQKAMGWYGHWYVSLEKCLIERYGDEALEGEATRETSEADAK